MYPIGARAAARAGFWPSRGEVARRAGAGLLTFAVLAARAALGEPEVGQAGALGGAGVPAVGDGGTEAGLGTPVGLGAKTGGGARAGTQTEGARGAESEAAPRLAGSRPGSGVAGAGSIADTVTDRAVGDPDAPALPEVVIKAPITTRPRDPSAALTVIDAEEYAGEARSVGRLAALAPGVVARDLGPGQMATLSIRGSTGDQVLVTLDGVPLAAPGGGAVDLSRLAPQFVERLEIVRGVVGARHGPGAMGGAVNVVTRVPGGVHLAGEVGAGSFGAGAGALTAGFSVGPGSYLLAASFGRCACDFPYLRDVTPEIPDNDRPVPERRGNNQALSAGLLGRARWDLGEAGEASLLVTADHLDRGVPGTVLFPFARAHVRAGGALAGLSWDGAMGPMGARALAWVRLDALDYTPESGDPLPQDGRAGGAQLSAGADLGGHRLFADLSLGGEWLDSPASGVRRRRSAGLGLADEIALGEQWRLSLAGRADQAGAVGALSARVALAGRAGRVRLGLGVGRSFRPPSFIELYYDAGPLASNPDLRPEMATGADLTVGARVGPLSVQTSAFSVRYADLIVYEFSIPLRARPLNIAAADALGVELEAWYRPSPLPLVVFGAYSFLHTVNRRPSASERGKLLPYRAPHRLLTRAAWAGERLSGFAEARLVSAVPRNRANTHFIPAQATVDAGAGARLWGDLWLHLKVENLLDAAGREDLFGYLLPGRSFLAHLRVQL